MQNGELSERIGQLNLTRRLTMDLWPDEGPPQPGDVLLTIGKRGPGTAYLLERVRLMNRRQHHFIKRWVLEVKILARGKETGEYRGQERVWEFGWYPRKKKGFSFPVR